MTPEPQYEFNHNQTEVIRTLANKMDGVGFVFVLLGVLQIAYGIALFMASRAPEALRAAEAAKLPVALGAALAGLIGLVHLAIGVWTRQAASGFRGIVHTRGQDISRLMEALGGLRKIYTLVYTLILIGVIAFLASVGQTLYLAWKGG